MNVYSKQSQQEELSLLPSDRFRRIGFLMQSLRMGGLESLVVRLAKELLSRGFLPEVFAYEDGEFRGVLESLSVPVHCFPKQDGYKPLFSVQLFRLFHERKLDLLHTHHFGPLIYAAPATTITRRKSRTIPLVHTVHSNEHLGREATRARWMFSAFARMSQQITAVNEVLASFLIDQLSIPAHKVKMVRNGVDSDLFHGKYDKKEIRLKLGFSEQNWLVGSVARLEPEKGHRFLLDALARCDGDGDGNKQVHLLLIGDGSERESLVAQSVSLGMKERVHFLGNRSDVPELLSIFDAFVLPSLREGLPLAMLEAMSSGIPIIGTKVGGVPDLLLESRGGLCVDAASVDALVGALQSLRKDPANGHEMVSCGQRWIREHYGQEKMVDEYIRAFKKAKNIRDHRRF